MFILRSNYPTLSLGINLSSDPCLRKMFPEINHIINILLKNFLISIIL